MKNVKETIQSIQKRNHHAGMNRTDLPKWNSGRNYSSIVGLDYPFTMIIPEMPESYQGLPVKVVENCKKINDFVGEDILSLTLDGCSFIRFKVADTLEVVWKSEGTKKWSKRQINLGDKFSFEDLEYWIRNEL